MTTQALLITALHCEAKPLVRHYRLKAWSDQAGFRLYGNDRIRLIVSGVGKAAAAAASTLLHVHGGDLEGRVWVNVGIAGHPSRSIGQCVLADTIRDHSAGRQWFPQIMVPTALPTDTLTTVDQPVDDYPANTLYDMEGSGFYPTALRFTSAELAHCCKIVSDNSATTMARIDDALVETLIGDNLHHIATTVGTLCDFAAAHGALAATPSDLGRFLGRWRFSVYEQNALHAALRRWAALRPGESIWTAALGQLKNSRAVLQHLEHRIAQACCGQDEQRDRNHLR